MGGEGDQRIIRCVPSEVVVYAKVSPALLCFPIQRDTFVALTFSHLPSSSGAGLMGLLDLGL